jgi:hypothetical protein
LWMDLTALLQVLTRHPTYNRQNSVFLITLQPFGTCQVPSGI